MTVRFQPFQHICFHNKFPEIHQNHVTLRQKLTNSISKCAELRSYCLGCRIQVLKWNMFSSDYWWKLSSDDVHAIQSWMRGCLGTWTAILTIVLNSENTAHNIREAASKAFHSSFALIYRCFIWSENCSLCKSKSSTLLETKLFGVVFRMSYV